MYVGEFKSWDDVASQFSAHRWEGDSDPKAEIPEPDQVLFAGYTAEGYEGSAYVVYRNSRKYYVVTGGHCSCYGLEGQWKPEEYTKKALIAVLERQLEKPYFYGPFTAGDARAILKKLKARKKK